MLGLWYINHMIKQRVNYEKVITFGTFDVFHIGHVHILERAREYGDYLLVGVSSDALNSSKDVIQS